MWCPLTQVDVNETWKLGLLHDFSRKYMISSFKLLIKNFATSPLNSVFLSTDTNHTGSTTVFCEKMMAIYGSICESPFSAWKTWCILTILTKYSLDHTKGSTKEVSKIFRYTFCQKIVLCFVHISTPYCQYSNFALMMGLPGKLANFQPMKHINKFHCLSINPLELLSA